MLAGAPEETIEVAEAPHLKSLMSYYTEQGVLARRERDMEAVAAEIEKPVATRYAELQADPPHDPKAAPPRTPGGVPWDFQTLLRNRPFDVWMHEQDIRRAIGRPGGYDSPVADHVLRTFGRSLAMVVGKRVAPPVGTVVRLEVPEAGLRWTVRVGDDGRAAPAGDEVDATTTVTLSPEELRGARGRSPATGHDGAADRRRRGDRAPPGRVAGGHPVSGSPSWTLDDIPDLTGKRALVTGVTSGIGESTVLELARRGAEVILGARNPAKLEATIARIEQEVPGATLHPLAIDVSDLASVRRAASEVTEPLHLLVNNAGVMATPHQRTADGLELQMATNYFGPFALTGLLFPRLRGVRRRTRRDGRLPGQPDGAPGATRRPAGPEQALRQVAGVLRLQAGRPAVRLRVRPSLPRAGRTGQGPRRPPRLLPPPG